MWSVGGGRYEHRPYYFVTSHKAHLAAMAVFRVGRWYLEPGTCYACRRTGACL